MLGLANWNMEFHLGTFKRKPDHMSTTWFKYSHYLNTWKVVRVSETQMCFDMSHSQYRTIYIFEHIWRKIIQVKHGFEGLPINWTRDTCYTVSACISVWTNSKHETVALLTVLAKDDKIWKTFPMYDILTTTFHAYTCTAQHFSLSALL